MSTEEPGCVYDADYYAHDCGRPYQRDDVWLRFFGDIADQIVRQIGPRSVLDAGCAMGFLVESLRDRGVEAFGLDISPYAIERVRPDIRPYCQIASVAGPLTGILDRRYDLIVCIEVLEHLPPSEAEAAFANLCSHTGDLLFSSTPDDLRERTHINVQPPEHWAELLARQGFYRDVDLDAGFITPWAGRFQRSDQPAHRVARDYERVLWQGRRQMASSTAEIAAAQTAAEQRNAEIAHLKAREAALQAELDALRQTTDERIAARGAEVADLQNELHRMRSSRGWRMVVQGQRLRARLQGKWPPRAPAPETDATPETTPK